MPLINPPTGPRMPAFACTLVGSAAEFTDLRRALTLARQRLAGGSTGFDPTTRQVAAVDRFLAQLGALQAVTVSEV